MGFLVPPKMEDGATRALQDALLFQRGFPYGFLRVTRKNLPPISVAVLSCNGRPSATVRIENHAH